MLPDATKLHAQYAKAAESDGQYKAAAAAYERAMNYQNATRYWSVYCVFCYEIYTLECIWII